MPERRAAAVPLPCVIVTRPAAQAPAWVEALHARGVPARALPLIDIVSDPQSPALQAAAAGLDGQALAVFVSPNAVESFLAARRGGWPESVRAGATGPGTVRALRAAGVPAACIVAPGDEAAQFDSEALWARLAGDDWRGRRVLIVRGNGGRDWLRRTLEDAGAQVQAVAAYARRSPAWTADERALAEAARTDPQGHVWLFSSSEAVANLHERMPQGWTGARALATHPRIAESARAIGFGRVDEIRPDPDAVAASLQSRPS